MSISIYAFVEEGGEWTETPVLGGGDGDFFSGGKGFWVRAPHLPNPPGIAIGYSYGYRIDQNPGESSNGCLCNGFANGVFYFLTLPIEEPETGPPEQEPPEEIPITLPPFPEAFDPSIRRTSDGDMEPGSYS
jgi:hypothetical protein